MPREPRTIRPLPGSGADKTPWPAVQIPRRCARGRKPLIHSGDRSFNRQLRHSKCGVCMSQSIRAFEIRNRYAPGGAVAPWVHFGFAQHGLETR